MSAFTTEKKELRVHTEKVVDVVQNCSVHPKAALTEVDKLERCVVAAGSWLDAKAEQGYRGQVAKLRKIVFPAQFCTLGHGVQEIPVRRETTVEEFQQYLLEHPDLGRRFLLQAGPQDDRKRIQETDGAMTLASFGVTSAQPEVMGAATAKESVSFEPGLFAVVLASGVCPRPLELDAQEKCTEKVLRMLEESGLPDAPEICRDLRQQLRDGFSGATVRFCVAQLKGAGVGVDFEKVVRVEELAAKEELNALWAKKHSALEYKRDLARDNASAFRRA